MTIDINAQLADEARHILKTTAIDLDAFLALSSEDRASRWRQFDRAAKFQLVALAIVKQTGRDWTVEEVEDGIAHYDGKYGAAPLPTEAAVCAALERLADENAQSARTARSAGEKADARFFQRAANAYVKALSLYRSGLRPQPTERGGWLLPSQRQGEPPHLLTKDGDWVCTCAAQASMHWAAALVIGIEVAGDILEAEGVQDAGDTNGGDDAGPWSDTARDGWAEHEAEQRLWQRLSAVRARYLRAA